MVVQRGKMGIVRGDHLLSSSPCKVRIPFRFELKEQTTLKPQDR